MQGLAGPVLATLEIRVSPVPLQSPSRYQEERIEIFPSIASWQWFCRRHRAALLQAHAISKPTGRLMVNPEAFDQVVTEVGYAALAEEAP
jgi:hypothetical protein